MLNIITIVYITFINDTFLRKIYSKNKKSYIEIDGVQKKIITLLI